MTTAVAVQPALAADAPPTFALSPVIDPTTGQFSAVDIALTFTGEADGDTHVTLPDQWGGFSQLYRYLSDIRAEGATITPGGGEAERILKHRPGARITLRYRVAKREWTGARDPTIGGNDYRPIVTPAFFHLIGWTIVARPANLSDEAPIAVDLTTLPRGMAFASDLEHGAAGRALTFRDLNESISVGGDFQLIDAGGGARLALRGSFDKRDSNGWREAFRRIAAAQRAFWRSGEEPFLVTVLAYAAPPSGGVSTGGTGLADSFAFFATRNADPVRLDQTMMHEMAHGWIAGKIGGSHLMGGREPEGYWLSEGFTEYVTMRTMVAAGLWTPQDFARELNERLERLATSQLVATPNAAAAKAFWTDGEAQQLPYRRGVMLAWLIDGRLREESEGKTGFDELLREMQARAARGSEKDAEGLLREIAAERGVAVGPLIERHIAKGRPIVLPDDLFAPCGTLTTREQPNFDLGFDAQGSFAAGNVVKGVRDNGPAWRAGLRDGMRMVGWSIWFGDATRTAEVVVADEKDDRRLSWMPQGERNVHVQQLQLQEDVGPACRARMGG